MRSVVLTESKGEARVDSRQLAVGLENQHKNVMKLIERYARQFKELGLLPFQTEAVKTPGARGTKRHRFALLNEDQAFLLLTMARNTDRIVELKTALVKAFRQAREGRKVTEAEYLPGYHEMHDLAQELADGSKNERFVHMNLNKLVNKTVGIESGQRQRLGSARMSSVVVAQHLAAQAMQAANDHHDGYAAAKKALGSLEILLLGKTA